MRFRPQDPIDKRQLNKLVKQIKTISNTLSVDYHRGVMGDDREVERAPYRQRWFRVATDDDIQEQYTEDPLLVQNEQDNRFVARQYFKCAGAGGVPAGFVTDDVPSLWAKEIRRVNCEFISHDTGVLYELIFFPWLNYIATAAGTPEEAVRLALRKYFHNGRVLCSFNRATGRWEANTDAAWSSHACVAQDDIEHNAFGSVDLAEDAGAVFTGTWLADASDALSVYNFRQKVWEGASCIVDVVSLGDTDDTKRTKVAGVIRSAWSATRMRGTSTASIAGGATGTLTAVIFHDGTGPPDPVSVINVNPSFTIGSGKKVWAELVYYMTGSVWEVYNAEC